jgi:hypothetical protein
MQINKTFRWQGFQKDGKVRLHEIFTQALKGLESFITMTGHRFPKFYNALQYAAFLKTKIEDVM